jgi:hypothetical protein
MITGSYEWPNSLSIQSIFDERLGKAELIVDIHSLKIIKQVLKKCLFLNPNEEPLEKIGDLLPLLKPAKDYCEKILNKTKIGYFTYDKLYKSFYEFLPGQRSGATQIPNPYDLANFEQ